MSEFDQSVEKVFSNKEHVQQCLVEAREIFGSTETTEKQYEGMMKALGFCIIYGPEELQVLIDATIMEANMRFPYFLTQLTDDRRVAV